MTSRRWIVAAALAAAMAPLNAAAQQTDETVGVDQPMAQTRGPMIVERVHSGFLVAPDFKVTRVDHQTSEFAGAYAGWVADETLFIGGGAYVLTNRSRDREMAYGGFVAQWMGGTSRTIGYSVKGLVGGGGATLTDSVTFQVPVFPPRGSTSPITFTNVTEQLRFRQSFFVAEPEANVLVRLRSGIHLTLGAGYRFIGTDRWNDDARRLRGATGSVGVQIGGGGS